MGKRGMAVANNSYDIRVSKTVYPNGEIVEHGRIEKLPENKHSFESELHVWREIHRETVKPSKKQTPKK